MKSKFLKISSNVNGIVLIIIGLIHTKATFFFYPKWSKNAPPQEALENAYFFAFMGIALIFAGITILYVTKKSSIDLKDKKSILKIQNLLVCITLIGALFISLYNVFSVILILASLVNLVSIFTDKNQVQPA